VRTYIKPSFWSKQGREGLVRHTSANGKLAALEHCVFNNNDVSKLAALKHCVFNSTVGAWKVTIHDGTLQSHWYMQGHCKGCLQRISSKLLADVKQASSYYYGLMPEDTGTRDKCLSHKYQRNVW